jgi:hypothetical protein
MQNSSKVNEAQKSQAFELVSIGKTPEQRTIPGRALLLTKPLAESGATKNTQDSMCRQNVKQLNSPKREMSGRSRAVDHTEVRHPEQSEGSK